MAAVATGCGGPGLVFGRTRSPLVLLLLLPLLPPRPALGNEGGAAGSCECERHAAEPPLVQRFPDRLLAWEPCRDWIRFTFPQKRVCGLAEASWVRSFVALKRDKRKGAARPSSPRRCCQPSATSPAPRLPLSSRGPALEVQSQQVPAFTATSTALALKTVRSAGLPWNGAIASPSLIPQEGLPARHSQTVVLAGLALFLVAGIVGLVCWWKPPRRRRASLVL